MLLKILAIIITVCMIANTLIMAKSFSEKTQKRWHYESLTVFFQENRLILE